MSALTEDVETTIQELEGDTRLSHEVKSLFKIVLHSPLDVAKSHGIESGRAVLATLKKYLSGSVSSYVDTDKQPRKVSYKEYEVEYKDENFEFEYSF